MFSTPMCAHSSSVSQQQAEVDNLRSLIYDKCGRDIKNAMLVRKNMYLIKASRKGTYFDEDWARDVEDFHRLQIKILKKIVHELGLPYDFKILQIETKEKTWADKHREILRCFSRCLRRALPMVLWAIVNKDYDLKSWTYQEICDFGSDHCYHWDEPDYEGQPIVIELQELGLEKPEKTLSFDISSDEILI